MPELALFSWPLIALGIFAWRGPTQGLIWTFLLGYLFLPEAYGYDLPGLPSYEKTTAIALSCLMGVLFCKVRGRGPDGGEVGVRDDAVARRVFTGLIALLFLGALATILTNTRPLIFPGNVVPGLGFRDYIAVFTDNVVLLIPFMLARRYLFDEAAHRELSRALIVCGLGYSLLALFEVRMSPQLNQMIYGYFQHGWNQHVRGGHWRPIIFLAHGLQVGFFFVAATLAAIGMIRSRAEGQLRWGYFVAAGWIFLVLLVSRNLGAVMIGVLFVPVALMLGLRTQIRIAVVIAIVVLLFPALRSTGIVPLAQIVSLAESISPERAGSLLYRLREEDAILDRAAEKPVFGWGVWARWRVRDEFGTDISVVDGLWIGTYGEWGWVGYLTFYGFLTAPIFLIARNARRRRPEGATIGLLMIVAANLVYTIPNSAGGPFIWLIAGALAGFAQRHRHSVNAELPDEETPRQTRYTRFAPDGTHGGRPIREAGRLNRG